MCDCGRVLNQNVDAATLRGAYHANQDMRSRRNLAVPLGIGGGVVLLLLLLRLILRILAS
jgi:hypothetical protein